jgi:hypothetical protein
MKTIVKNIAYSVIVIAGTWLFPQQIFAQEVDSTQYDNSTQNNNSFVQNNNSFAQNNVPDQNQPVTLQVFYDELSPYGTWIKDPNYGFVWSPNVDQNFKPYVTNGHWVNSDYGWTWVSDFPWGWAAFHYGRWTVDPQYGNIWIPDTVWGPAWVSWRESEGYVGWTPMGPGVDIDYALGGSYYVPYDQWNFVRDRDFMQYNLFGYCLGRSLINGIFNTSYLLRGTLFDNYRHSSYFYGPSRGNIQRYAGRMINPVHIRDYNRPGQSYGNGYLSMYRPQVQRSNAYGRMAAPRSLNNNMVSRSMQNNNRGYSSSNGNAYYQGRGAQAMQQSKAYQTRSQGLQQPSRYTTSGYQGRNIQSAQRPNQNSYRSQGVQQATRYASSNYQGRSAQPVYRQMSQQQGRSYQSGGSASNYRQPQARSYASQSSQRSQPSSSQRQGNSRGSSGNERGRR